jgi:hypothetical protein
MVGRDENFHRKLQQGLQPPTTPTFAASATVPPSTIPAPVGAIDGSSGVQEGWTAATVSITGPVGGVGAMTTSALAGSLLLIGLMLLTWTSGGHGVGTALATPPTPPAAIEGAGVAGAAGWTPGVELKAN